ncbi:GTPase [Belnapia rosea]|uniref:GTP-binding protein EngB required for normal cell division n=1 Tax=Belnapia rosea TaxID=938405 RepID=A0A1G7ASC0_9PROT|nr:GTPase [Belnapia rosea]SDB74005.1 GTP-binding protein EngB required for normal cell division [Belnapia rosea]SDE17437.1 GTP-binding protein EngB required for normal cell division [Belnapia rosea]
MLDDTSPPDNAALRAEMEQVQRELSGALESLLKEAGARLKPAERDEIVAEFKELDILLERLKSGLVWIAIFGRTTAGKSAVTNAIMGADVAKVGIQHDLTREATAFEKRPWKIVDVPGVMGNEVLEDLAVTEAKRALGHVFVIEAEPFAPEIKLFDAVHAATPDTQKIVLFNKWDMYEGRIPAADVAMVKAKVFEKMRKYVASDEDIVFGSALRYDPASDMMVRQELPQLMDRLYAGAGTLGQVINVIDPANRASELLAGISGKVAAVRTKVARKVVFAYGLASVAGGAVPLDTLTVQPGLFASEVFVLSRIFGKTMRAADVKGTAKELLKTCGILFAAEFAAITAADVASTVASVFVPFLAPIFGIADAALLSWYRYRRAVIFGEVAMEYVKRDFSWGGEEPRAIIAECKARAQKHYARFEKASDAFGAAGAAGRRA